MSLFGPVVVVLTAQQSAALERMVAATEQTQAATESVAFTLNALFTALTAGSGLTPEQEAQVAALIAQLKASGEALGAAEAANP